MDPFTGKLIGSAIGGAGSKPQANKASGGLGSSSVYVDGMQVGVYESDTAKAIKYGSYVLIAVLAYSYFKK